MYLDREIIIPLILNLMVGIGIWAFTQNWRFSLLIVLAVGGITLAVYWVLSFRNVGLMRWYPKRGSAKSFRECLSDCTASVDFLATWGGSIPSLSPKLEERFRELVDNGCKLRFLILRPGSESETRRIDTRQAWPTGQPETDIRWLLNIKESFGTLAGNFRIALYDATPVWAIVLIDNERAVVGFYGKGLGRDNPGILVQRLKDKPSFFEAFRMEYERMWNSAFEVHSIVQFEAKLSEWRGEKSEGIVFAITGPSGSGKTSHCRKLVEDGLGAGCTTVTTRPPRPDRDETHQYRFVSNEEFEALSSEGKLLAEAEFCGNRYGIEPRSVFDPLYRGDNLILDTIIPLDILRAIMGKRMISIFLTTSSVSILKERLESNAFEDSSDAEARWQDAKSRMASAKDSDYIIFTDEAFESAYQETKSLVQSLTKSYRESSDLFPKTLSDYQTEIVLSRRSIDVGSK